MQGSARGRYFDVNLPVHSAELDAASSQELTNMLEVVRLGDAKQVHISAIETWGRYTHPLCGVDRVTSPRLIRVSDPPCSKAEPPSATGGM